MKDTKEFKQGLPLAPGVTRDLLVDADEYTLVRMYMKKGVADPPHSHPHVQADYIVSGCADMACGDEVVAMEAGDCIKVGSNVPHAFKLVKEDMVVLEYFVPRRDDIVKFHSAE